MNRDVRAVFFDAVGTLLFPEPSAPVVYAAVAREHGLVLSPEVIRNRFIKAFREEEAFDLDAGWVTSEAREWERWRRIVFATLKGAPDPEACFQQLYAHFSQAHAWRVNEHAAEAFATLADRGVVLGLASNYDSRLSQVLIGTPDLAPLRKAVVISSEVGYRKPAAKFFEAVVHAAGCERSSILFVGDDRENDFEGASAAGLQVVLFDPHGRENEPARISNLRELCR